VETGPWKAQEPLITTTIDEGRLAAAQSSIAVCAILRDESDSIKKNFPGLLSFIRHSFKSYRMYIVENDSTDDTRPLLQQMQLSDPNIKCQMLDLDQKHSLQQCNQGLKNCSKRGQLLAYLRNKCMRWAMNDFAECEYVLVLDIDYEHIWFDGILHSIAKHSEWDVVCANSINSWLKFLGLSYDIGSFDQPMRHLFASNMGDDMREALSATVLGPCRCTKPMWCVHTQRHSTE